MEIQVMHRQGMSMRAISRQLGISRNTVKKYLESPSVPQYRERNARQTKLGPYEDYLQGRVEAARPDWIPASVLFTEIQALGYPGGVRSVSSYLASFKPQPKPDPVVRFETEPGQQAQVDWGSFKLNGQRISLFLITLGWSRFAFGEFVENEQFETLRTCHEHAFDDFGGVPQELLYDNMRTVVQQRNAYGRGLHRFHPGLGDFAHHYGFTPRLCKPYRAKTKGKVERNIGYVRYSFYVPLISRYKQLGEPLTLEILNLEFARWLALTANSRTHSTTKQVPEHRLQQEQNSLQSLPPVYFSGAPRVGHLKSHLVTQYTTETLQHPLSVYDQLLEPV